MEPERWQRIEQIFHDVMACESSQRSAVLDRCCAGDAFLRGEVESLLRYGQETAPALEKPALDVVAECLAEQLREKATSSGKMIGSRIGQYKLVARIGAGGMGEVYRAVRADDEYQRYVALKLVRDLLRDQDSSFFLAQFRNERQILANLQHPNIARLFDGGTTEDGVPYFVMELVDGQPITDYCDRHRLSIPERLRLFLQIASAVQYAHQRLIVHRDIKPANLLVTAEAVPVLLDFGIAKIIDPAVPQGGASATLTGMRMMTPEYACPEQVRGEAVTTATDVYSLGVVLYELLSGRRPYRFMTQNPLEMARVICEEEPRRPSTVVTQPILEGQGEKPRTLPQQISAARGTELVRLTRQLRGDLDAILLKALRKEPEQRYATAGELADDIRRYLDGRPILARRGTNVYRARKFISRHRAVVAVTAVACVLALVGIISIVRAEREARVQQLRAERRFNDVRALANSMLFEIHDSIRDLPGSTEARRLLVDRALKYLDSLARESGGDPDLQRELAAAYERVGAVQGNPLYANLGNTAGALESYRKALKIRQSLAASGQAADQVDLTNVYMDLANTLIAIGDFQGALNLLQEAAPISEKLASADGSDSILQENYAGMCFTLGRAFGNTGDLARSAEYYRRSAEIRERISEGSPAFLLSVKTKLAGAYGYLSGVESERGNLDEAIQLQSKAHDILSRLLATDPNNATLFGFLLQSDYWIGYYLFKKGMPAEALKHYKIALAGDQKLAAADQKDKLAARNLADCYVSIGRALAATGKLSAGIDAAQRGNQILDGLANEDSSLNRYTLVDLASSRAVVAEAYERRAASRGLANSIRIESWRNARAWYAKSLDAWSRAKKNGTLDASDQDEPDRIAKKIAECDAALSRAEMPQPGSPT